MATDVIFPRHRLAAFAIQVALVVAAIFVARALWRSVALHWWLPIPSDGQVYATIGRGIVNGLTPYRDLFDYKPPGIFALTALSYAVGNSLELARMYEFVALVAPVGLAVAAAWRRGRDAASALLIPTLMAFVFGSLTALYTSDLCGGIQTEIFGNFFSMLYLWTVWRYRKTASPFLYTGATALLLLLAGSFKEPYWVITGLSALLIVDSPKEWWSSYVRPALVGAAAGLAVLAALGWLGPFLSLYLPELVEFMIRGNHAGGVQPMQAIGWIQKLIARVAFKHNVLVDAWKQSPGYSVALLLLILFYMRNRSASGRKRRRVEACRMAGAFALLNLAVYSGLYVYKHHFAMACPFYMALFFGAVDSKTIDAERTGIFFRTWFFLFSAALAAAVGGFRHSPTEPSVDNQLAEETKTKRFAAALDRTLTRCGEKNYVFMGGFNAGPIPSVFTRHSPAGPIFFLLPHFAIPGSWPSDAYNRELASAKIVVYEPRSFRMYPDKLLLEAERIFLQQLATEFTTQAPACADAALFSQDVWRVYFPAMKQGIASPMEPPRTYGNPAY